MSSVIFHLYPCSVLLSDDMNQVILFSDIVLQIIIQMQVVSLVNPKPDPPGNPNVDHASLANSTVPISSRVQYIFKKK